VLWPLRWALRVVVGLVVLCLVVFAWTALRVWRTGLTDSRPRSDAIVVEGAAQYDGRPSAVLEARLAHALDLYHAGVAPRIVTVGGRRTGDRFTEAGAGRTWLLGRGVPAGSVVAVEQGSDTLLSLRAAETVLSARGWQSVVLVTDPWHELRSRAIARDLGLRADSSPVTEGPATRGLGTQVRYVGRESVAYLYYRLFHRASRAGPSAV
jgi:uncharacterized SAM-binding protein YcdF (DUF218 family)